MTGAQGEDPKGLTNVGRFEWMRMRIEQAKMRFGSEKREGHELSCPSKRFRIEVCPRVPGHNLEGQLQTELHDAGVVNSGADGAKAWCDAGCAAASEVGDAEAAVCVRSGKLRVIK